MPETKMKPKGKIRHYSNMKLRRRLAEYIEQKAEKREGGRDEFSLDFGKLWIEDFLDWIGKK